MKEICRKIIIFIVLIFCVVIIGQINVSAESYEEMMSDIIHESGADSLQDNISTNAEDFFEKNAVKADEPESILNIKAEDILTEIKDEIKRNIRLPLKLFSSLMAVIIVSSFAGNLGNTVKIRSCEKITGQICVLVAISMISEPLSECFYSSVESVRAGAVFMTGFIPVFSGITAAGGGVSSAASYSTLIYIAAEAALQLSDSVIMPVLGMCMALSVVDAVNQAVSLRELINGFRKAVTRFIVFIMMIFTGLLSIQSIVGTSADSLALKTGRYIASNFIPVVGSAVSDAYAALKSSMGLLRGGTGSFGIITLIIMLLPSVVSSGLYYCSMKLAFICADIFGESSLSRLFSDMCSVLSVIFSLMVCFAVIMVISTTIVMMTGMSSV